MRKRKFGLSDIIVIGVKCATLAWKAMGTILEGSGEDGK